MGMPVMSEPSPAARLLSQVETWPGVSRARAECGVGHALAVRGTQILHVHSESAVELRLGRPAIDRMGEVLAHSGQAEIRSSGDHGEDWVGIRLYVAADEALAVALASVAIQSVEGTRGPMPIVMGACALAGGRRRTARRAGRSPATGGHLRGRLAAAGHLVGGTVGGVVGSCLRLGRG